VLYLRICFDADGIDDLRNELRQTHRAYLKPFAEGKESVRVVQAGPMCISDSDDTNLGSFLIVEAPSFADLQRFHDNDPFTAGGVFGEVRLLRWDRHIGN